MFSAYQKKEKDLGSIDNIASPVKENSAPEKAKQIAVLDAKKSQNCTILLKTIKMTAEQIKTAIGNVDDHALPREVVTELLKYVPQEEEISAILPFESEAQNLAPAEFFYLECSRIPQYAERLQAIHFKAAFKEYTTDLENWLGALDAANKTVTDGKKFRHVLEIVLALGNLMNTGQRGGAYGFKLDSLLKLGDTKSTITNRKHTLLHYLVDLIQAKFPDVTSFPEELSPVETGAKVSIPIIRQTLMQVREGLKRVKTLLDISAKNSNSGAAAGKTAPGGAKPKDQFVPVMTDFYSESEALYKTLDEKAKRVIAEFEKAVTAYAEDPKTATPEEFFGTFGRFAQAYLQAKAENEAVIARAAEEAKKEEQRRQREEQQRTRKKLKDGGDLVVSPTGQSDLNSTQSPTTPTAAGGDAGGGFDDLISAIRSGKAFGPDFRAGGKSAAGGAKKARGAAVG